MVWFKTQARDRKTHILKLQWKYREHKKHMTHIGRNQMQNQNKAYTQERMAGTGDRHCR